MQQPKFIGLAQLTSTTNLQENFESCSLIAEKASKSGVKFLCFPECFAYLGEPGGGVLQV
jgi:predicted amidohydrolase